MISTPGILESAAPADWHIHRFGLSQPQWEALRGRAFWITGGGTGYGQALTIALAAAQATVFISGRRPGTLLTTVSRAEALGVSKPRIIPVPCDVTSPEQVDTAITRIRSDTDQLFGLVNNAALPQPRGLRHPLLEVHPAQWQALLSTNVTGPLLVARAAVRLMGQGGRGRILFITSEAGWAFTPGFGPYNVSKAALNNLGASFAAECAAAYPDADLQINVLVPGEARTEMNQGSTVSPFAIVSMALVLLSHPAGGPNGRFFHRDGRHLSFGYAPAYEHNLLAPITTREAPSDSEVSRSIDRRRPPLQILRRIFDYLLGPSVPRKMPPDRTESRSKKLLSLENRM